MANKFKPATKSDRAKVIKTLLKEGISKVKDTFEISNMAIQDVVYIDPKYYPECSVGCVLIEAHGDVVDDIITIMKKLGYRYAKDFGDSIVLVFAPKGVSDNDIEDALDGKINESTDVSVKEIVRSKIIKYAQDRLNKSGAVLLAPVYDMINFNDPLDGMISFDYLNTIAENEELSEEESGYDYIEQAVTDIANFIQNQGFIMDEDSDDPLVFIDENYDEEDDEELDDMNESVKWTETDEPNQWVNKLTKNKEAIDPITLECKDLGVAVFASKLSEDADNNFYKVMIVNSNTGKSMTKSLPFDGIDLESAISKLKKCDNKDDLYDTISKYLFLRKSDVFKLFGISMNESASITKTDNYDEFNLLPPGNKFMDPIKLENKELGIWATAGVMFDEDDPDNEDDYSAVVLVSPLDPKYENYVVAGDFGDNYSAAKNIMKKLAQIKTPDELAKIIKDKKFSDYYGIKSNTDFLVDVVRKLYSKMNESTVMNEAASIKKSDRYREFDLLPKGKGWMDPIELTNRDAGFYAIAGTAYDSTDRNNEDEWGIIVSLTPLDSKYEDILITGSFYDYEEAAEGIMNRLSRAKTPSDVARIINNQEFSDEWGDDESEFLSALTKSFKAQNESTMMNEAVQVTKPKPNEAKSHYISKEGSTMIQNKQLGFYAIIGDYYDEDEPEFEGDISAYISTLGTSTVSIDDKKINEVLESTFDNRNKANTMMKELSDVDNLTDLAKILRKYEFYNSDMDTTKGQREFISILESKISNINESTNVINESAQIRPCDPALEGFDLLDSNNPFDFEPVDLENTELGFYAIAGVATGANPGAVWVEDDCSIEICITALDPDYTDEVLVAEYYDVDYKAMNVMQELASATSYNKLTSILVKEGFQGMNSGPFDFVDDLEAINSMNEATEVPDGRMTVELDDTDVVEGDTLLLAELTDDVFNAVNTVLDELDPDADVEITIDNEDLLQLAVVSDEDLDDDAFDQVLSELLEDMDLEDIVADMTDSEPIEDPDDEDFGRVIQYINFYPATGATVVPDNSVMEDNVDVIEDEESINESASTKTDFIKLLEKLADEFKKEFKSNPDVDGTSFSFVKKGKDKVVIQAIAGSVNPGSRALSNYLNFLDDNGVEYKTLQKFEYYKGALNCTIYTTIKIIDIKDEDVINESFKLNTDLTKFVDKLADSFFGSIKDANFLNLEDEDGNLYFQVSTGDKSYSRKLLTNFLAFLAKKNVDFDLVNKVNVTGNSTFWNATVTVKINNKQGSQVQYRNELNESTDVSDRVWKYVDDFNFKSGVKFLEGDDKIEKVLKSISPKLDIRSYHLDKLPWTTYTIDGKDKVAVVCISGRLYSPMAIAITDGKNISDFVSNAKSTLVFTNKKLEDWNNVTIVARIMNNLAKVTDRASEYKAIKSLLDKYEKQVYNYEQFDESVDDDNSEAIGSYDYSESAKSPKLPTQSELKTIIQKSMIKFGERHTQVTVHAYRTSKYEGGVVEVDLDGTSLATDGREEDYYDEDNIKNALEYAAKELVDKFGQDKDLLDYIDVQYNKVGSLTITFSLDSELNESYSMNEATKVTFHFDDQKDWVSPEDFKKIEKFATKMEDALERYLRRLRDLGPDDKLKDQVYTEIRVENKEKIIIETKTKKKVLKKDIDKLLNKGNGPSPSTNLSQLPLDEVKATSRGIGWGISPIDKSLGIFVYTGFKALAEPWDPAKAKAEWDAAHPKKPASALKSKLEEIAKGIEKYVKSHPDYKKFNLSKDVVHVGEDYIQITVDTPDVEVGKSILIDTDKFISKNYKDLETHSQSKDGSKPVWSVYVMKSSAAKDLMNESTNYKKFANKLETFINDEIDTIYDEMVVSVDETGYGYNINVTFDNRLLGSNPSKIISKIINFIVERNGEYSDLVHYNNKVTGDYKLVFSYKGKLNECAIIGPDETDIDSLRANELSRALSSEQPLVDPYDIRCTIRPVFVRKDQFLFDGSTVYKATANASTDKDSGTTEIKVDVLLSTDPDISDASMTLTLPTEFDGLKLLRGNPTKVYNESADVKADTVTLSFANEDEANEFIKDNGVQPEKSFEGKFGWTVILKKSDLKKIK